MARFLHDVVASMCPDLPEAESLKNGYRILAGNGRKLSGLFHN